MNRIFGYGEDALTLWALRKQLSEILRVLNDKSVLLDCLIFFRPSFGRSGGEGSAEFGEFDAILASLENVYLIESKWDNFTQNKEDEIEIKEKQILRHRIFSWYFINWGTQQYGDWKEFSSVRKEDFTDNFADRRIAPEGSLLARNLEYILNRLYEHCKKSKEPRNILLYFYGSKSKPIKRVTSTRRDVNFEVISIDYGQYISGNFIPLD